MADETAPRVPDAIRRALGIAKQHPGVTSVGEPSFDRTSGRTSVILGLEVNLANAWRARGVSSTGVRAVEEIRVDFPPNYPIRPPEFSLRPDFSRENAHVQPWLSNDGRPVPCLVDGDQSEATLQFGFGGLLNQVVIWLDRASQGTLIDHTQGWEPTRRDQLDDIVICDMSAMRARIRDEGGHQIFFFNFNQSGSREEPGWCIGELQAQDLEIEKVAPKNFGMEMIEDSPPLYAGRGPAVLIWPDVEKIADVYYSETVTDLSSLRERAGYFHCDAILDVSLTRLKVWAETNNVDHRTGLLVLFCARRPCNLIGENSSFEISPYLVWDYKMDEPEAGSVPVRPAGHRARIGQELLARVSGLPGFDVQPTWTLLGAGSLGSKVGLHLARAGLAPSVVVDKRVMSPHNAARHALLPMATQSQLPWMQPKAALLCGAIRNLGQTSSTLEKDIRDVTADNGLSAEAWPESTKVVVNTTASLAVREALNAASSTLLATRVIETSLYAEGQVGLIGVEGPDRNPRLGDLLAEFYALAAELPGIATRLAQPDARELSRVRIGEGCGSETMPMTDGRISIFAAGMSEYLLGGLTHGLHESSGELLIGQLSGDGLGVEWSRFELPPVTAIGCDGTDDWSVRLHHRAASKISAEVANWPGVETGGALIGRISEASRTISVVDVVPAPEDSVRSKHEFVLGTAGLSASLERIVSLTGGSLYCVGTWHNHLDASAPSGQDQETALAIALARCAPSALLIHTPNGYQAVMADRTRVDGPAGTVEASQWT